MEKISLEQVRPEDIERRSFEIIRQKLKEMHKEIGEREAPLVLRAIHTTADFDYADNLVFSPDAIECGLLALRQGAVIVTDTNMAKAGVNKKRLGLLGGEVFCFMADEDVARASREEGTTRASASMDKAASLFGQGSGEKRPVIIAVGNAPTALVRLAKLMEDGKIRPALIIGAPVGFVNVVQSKECIMAQHKVPYIVAAGQKGGSNVAAALCNALLYQL